MAQSALLLEMQLDVFHRDGATKAGSTLMVLQGLQLVTEDGGKTEERKSLAQCF